MEGASRLLALVAATAFYSTGGLTTKSSAAPTSKDASEMDYFVPQFYAPQLTPTQFLFVSSPSQRKIVYTELKNFKSVTGRSFALVDSGLAEPAGMAFDQSRGFLYVADRGASRIYRYRILVQEQASQGRKSYALATDGVQLCIMQGASVEWVSVDISGDVFYSDTAANTINRIPADTIDRLAEGAYQCGDLRVVSEKLQMMQARKVASSFQSMSDADREALQPTDAPNTMPVIFSVYEGKMNPHVTVPAGVVSDGARLYWTNKEAGSQAGTLVQGSVQPELPLAAPGQAAGQPAPFPSTVLTSEADVAYGIAKSNTMVFYTTNQSGTGYVYGLIPGGRPHAFVSNLIEPRGLCWDGDNTVYVADERSSRVFSFPVGRLMEDAPLTQSAALKGAFGVALFTLPKGKDIGDIFLQSAAAGLRRGPSVLCRALGLVAALSIATFVRA